MSDALVAFERTIPAVIAHEKDEIKRDNMNLKRKRDQNDIMNEKADPKVAPPLKKAASIPALPLTAPKPTPKKLVESTEKRIHPFRPSASNAVRERMDRARTQRMFLVERKPHAEFSMSRDFVVLGSIGNVYTVNISHEPRCSCPDFDKGNLCKHILFVLMKVLKVKNQQLIWQKALLTSELQEIFAAAPKDPAANVMADAEVVKRYNVLEKGEEEPSVPQKPLDEEDLCGICYEELVATTEPLVYCKASCGKSLHKSCWNEYSNHSKTELQCIYCRAPWKSSDNNQKKPALSREDSKEGYLNLQRYQSGMSDERDTSTYHQFYDDYRGGYGGYRYGYHGRRW